MGETSVNARSPYSFPQLLVCAHAVAGMTLLSATDLLWLVGLSSEYNEARDWIQHHLNFSRNFQADTFTLSMTFLGSLLSLNDLTSDPMYLEKALDIANR